jgi:hypothetical protein
MTIRQKISDALGAKNRTADPAALRRRIAEQHALVQSLDAEHAQASLEWASGASGSSAKLEELEGRLGTARREARALAAALSLAEQHEAQRERERLAALSAAQIRAVEQHFAARDKAAEELAIALDNAASAYRRLVERSQKAHGATPLGMTWPLGSPWHVGELRALVEREIYRLSSNGSLSGAEIFPGGKCGDLRNLNQPDKLEPLTDALKRFSAFTLGEFKGHKPPAPAQATQPAQASEPAQHDDGASPEYDADALLPGTVDARNVALPAVKMS